MISRMLVTMGLLLVLAGTSQGQPKQSNTNECVWYLPCSSAHCNARIATNQGNPVGSGSLNSYIENLGSLYSDGYVAQFQAVDRSEEHTSELQSLRHLVCR